MLATFKRVFYQLGYLAQHLKAQNLKAFFVCVIVASFLWLFNALRKEYTETIHYPVGFEFNRDKYMAVGGEPPTIPLLVKGSGWQILRKMAHLSITPITFPISPEFQMKHPYMLRNEIFKETEKVLKNVRLEDVVLDTLKFDVDYRYKRVLRLAVDSNKLNLQKDYRVVSAMRIKPELVAVIGPKKLLKRLPNPYFLDMHEVKILDDQFNKTFQIDIAGVPTELLTQDEKKVQISFEVERFVQRNINIALQIGNGDKKQSFNLPVSYSVRESKANDIKASDFVFEADWTDYKKEDGTVTIHLRKRPADVLRSDIFYIKRLKID